MFNVVMVESNGQETLCGMYGTDVKEFSRDLAARIAGQLSRGVTDRRYEVREVR